MTDTSCKFKLAKRKTPRENFALRGERGGLLAVRLAAFEKVDETFIDIKIMLPAKTLPL